MAGGHAWQGGRCGRLVFVVGGVHGTHAPSSPQQIRGDTVNERAAQILLECILVLRFILSYTKSY